MKVVLLSELTFILQPMGTAQRSGAILRISGASEAKDSPRLIISISRKACFSDYAACEGFFGRLKNEMF